MEGEHGHSADLELKNLLVHGTANKHKKNRTETETSKPIAQPSPIIPTHAYTYLPDFLIKSTLSLARAMVGVVRCYQIAEHMYTYYNGP